MNNELARRAVASPHWRWMPGMRYLVYREDGLLIGSGFVQNDRFSNPLAVPCMPHPATLGCLLALVREAWGCPTLYCHYSTFSESWLMIDPRLGWELGLLPKSTEAAALVAALEAAP